MLSATGVPLKTVPSAMPLKPKSGWPRGDVDRNVVDGGDVRQVDGVRRQGTGGCDVEEARFAGNVGGGGRGLVGGRVDVEGIAPAGMAVEGRASVQEAQPVEIGVALDIDQHLGVAAGYGNIVKDDVADRMGDVIAGRLAAIDLNGGVGIGVGGHRISAAGDGDVLDQGVADEAKQNDVAIAVVAAIAVPLECRVRDVDRAEPKDTASRSDALRCCWRNPSW